MILNCENIIRNLKLYIISDIELDEEYLNIWNNLESTFKDLNIYKTKNGEWCHLLTYGKNTKSFIMAYRHNSFYSSRKTHIFLHYDVFFEYCNKYFLSMESVGKIVRFYINYKFGFTCGTTIMDIGDVFGIEWNMIDKLKSIN